MKKWINLSAIWISVALAVSARSEQGTVLKDRVNIRTRPDKNSEVATQARKDDVVEVVEHKGEWLRIVLPVSAKCFVAAKFVTDGAANADAINVRSGRGTQYHEVGKLSKGERVEMIATNNEWMQIKPTPNCSGWIAAEYVQVEAAPTPAGAPPAPPAPAVSNPSPATEIVPPPVATPRAAPASPAVREINTDPDVITRDVVLEGIIQPVGKDESAVVSHELVTPAVDHLQHRICLVDLANLKINHLLGKPVRVYGREQWRKGERDPVLTASRVDRVW